MTARRAFAVFLYFTAPMLGAVTPLLVFPSITTHFGADGLAAVGIAQSLGSAAAIIGELGWSVIGPQRIAASDAPARAQLVRSSLASRIITMSVLLPVAAVLAFVLAPVHKLDAAILTIGFGAVGMSVTWALIGANRPGLVLLLDSLPRLAAVTAVVIALSMGAPLWVYAVGLFLASLFATIAGSSAFRLRELSAPIGMRAAFGVIRAQSIITLSRGISAAFTALPVTLVAIVSPASVPLFTAVDRLCRMSLAVLSAVPNRLQSWVGEVTKDATGARLRQRNLRQLGINGAIGIVAATGYAVLLPLVTGFVFSGVVELAGGIGYVSAAIILVVCISRGLGLGLVAYGRSALLLPASAIAATVGVTTVLLLGSAWGAVGATLGVLCAEVAGALFQAVVLRRAMAARP